MRLRTTQRPKTPRRKSALSVGPGLKRLAVGLVVIATAVAGSVVTSSPAEAAPSVKHPRVAKVSVPTKVPAKKVQAAAVACQSGKFTYNRTESCFSGIGSYTVLERKTGAVLGGAGLNLKSQVKLNPRNRSSWTQTVTVELVSPWGAAVGTSGILEMVCSACSSTGGGMKPLLPDTPETWTFEMSSPGTATVTDNEKTQLTLRPDFPNSTSDTGQIGPYTHPRCDSTKGVGPKAGGCVYPQFAPTYDVSTTSTKTAEVAWHILWAQKNLQHHWGWKGQGSVLTRTRNQALNDKNRNTACPKSIPRPPGKSCDEYPFASTYQGASRNADFSCHMINKQQNSNEGSLRRAWYNQVRLLEKDKFWVNVVQPSGAASKAQVNEHLRALSQCPG